MKCKFGSCWENIVSWSQYFLKQMKSHERCICFIIAFLKTLKTSDSTTLDVGGLRKVPRAFITMNLTCEEQQTLTDFFIY